MFVKEKKQVFVVIGPDGNRKEFTSAAEAQEFELKRIIERPAFDPENGAEDSTVTLTEAQANNVASMLVVSRDQVLSILKSKGRAPKKKQKKKNSTEALKTA